MAPEAMPPKRRRANVVWRMFRAVLLAYLIVLLLAMWFEESLIFFPSRYPVGDWQPADLNFEDAWFQAPDGTKLHGWYVPHDDPRAIVLLAHGNAGNLSQRAGTLRVLHRIGASVMIFDYRGYGRSEGKPDEAGVLADARAAWAWLSKRTAVEPREITLMGASIGAAVVVDLAVEQPARGLILESTFTSLPDVAAHHYPWLPVRTMMRSRLESVRKIGHYHGPLLQSHGDADSIIPIELGKRLFEAANEPKRLVVIPDHDHNDPLPAVYFDELDAFFDRLD